METRRVVVTGLGALTPVGNTADEFWAALLQGRSGVGPITRFDASRYPTRIAGEVRNFDPLKYVDRKDARRLDPYLHYAIACSCMAVEDAGLDTGAIDGERLGVLIGSGIGGIHTLLEYMPEALEPHCPRELATDPNHGNGYGVRVSDTHRARCGAGLRVCGTA